MDKSSIYSPYRPHNPGHDYYGSGIYLITLVVRGREAIMGTLANDGGQPAISLSPLGQIVQEEWEHTVQIQQRHGRHLRLLAQCIMPDHWHGVIEVEQDMDKSIGAIIQATKSACTSRWWQMSGMLSSPSSAESIRHMHALVREQYYAEHDCPKPLFDANYDDTICIDDRHRQAMINYVHDNPRRAWLRRQHPDLFKLRRELHRYCDGIDLTFSQRYRYIALNTIGSLLTAENQDLE